MSPIYIYILYQCLLLQIPLIHVKNPYRSLMFTPCWIPIWAGVPELVPQAPKRSLEEPELTPSQTVGTPAVMDWTTQLIHGILVDTHGI